MATHGLAHTYMCGWAYGCWCVCAFDKVNNVRLPTTMKHLLDTFCVVLQQKQSQTQTKWAKAGDRGVLGHCHGHYYK